jgi:hypothetical protein
MVSMTILIFMIPVCLVIMPGCNALIMFHPSYKKTMQYF